MEDNRHNLDARAVITEFIDNVVRGSARTLMRFGASARDFSDISRWSFVRAFYTTPDLWIDSRPTIQSASIKTGIPRAKARALNASKSPERNLFNKRQNLAYRVIDGWVNDAEFHADGKPASLPIRSFSGPSFNKLVMKYGNDVTYPAVLKDLENEGCVERHAAEVVLVNPTYGIQFIDQEKLRIAGYMMRRLAETTDHNLIHADPKDRKLQRVWRQMHIPVDRAEEVIEKVTEIAVSAGRQLDREMAKFAVQDRNGEACVEIGIAMYLYEDPSVAVSDSSICVKPKGVENEN